MLLYITIYVYKKDKQHTHTHTIVWLKIQTCERQYSACSRNSEANASEILFLVVDCEKNLFNTDSYYNNNCQLTIVNSAQVTFLVKNFSKLEDLTTHIILYDPIKNKIYKGFHSYNFFIPQFI